MDGSIDIDGIRLREVVLRANLAGAVNEFFNSVDNYQYAVHTRPILRAINTLPRKELGETESSFHLRVPLSWIKKRELLGRELS